MSRNPAGLRALGILLFLAIVQSASPQAPAKGRVTLPPSTVGTPGIPRTSVLLFIPEGTTLPLTQPAGETPASIACIYGLTKQVQGCPINGTSAVPSGGSRAIALVEYGRYPQVQSDLNTFSQQFGLPTANFEEVCIDKGGCPDSSGTGADLEMALDVQWAHAMAPNAKIYAVETATIQEFFTANQKGGELVAGNGGGEVANTWLLTDEPKHEQGYDKYFKSKGIVYLFSAGDWGLNVFYPSPSPFVVSVGGTTIERDSSGNFTGESCWKDSSGGISKEELRPAYQDIIKERVGKYRGTPDISFDGDPNTGVAVYSSSYCGGWCITGGTSIGSPAMAGVINSAGNFSVSTNDELTKIYNEYANKKEYHKWFRDITTGNNGKPATKGWDQCTGVGSPVGYQGK